MRKCTGEEKALLSQWLVLRHVTSVTQCVSQPYPMLILSNWHFIKPLQ